MRAPFRRAHFDRPGPNPMAVHPMLDDSSMRELWDDRYRINKKDMIVLYNFCVKDFNVTDFCVAFGVYDRDHEKILRILYGIPHAIYTRWAPAWLGRAGKAFDHCWSALSDFIDHDDVTNLLCGSEHPQYFFAEDIKAIGDFSEVCMNFAEEYPDEDEDEA